MIKDDSLRDVAYNIYKNSINLVKIVKIYKEKERYNKYISNKFYDKKLFDDLLEYALKTSSIFVNEFEKFVNRMVDDDIKSFEGNEDIKNILFIWFGDYNNKIKYEAFLDFDNEIYELYNKLAPNEIGKYIRNHSI